MRDLLRLLFGAGVIALAVVLAAFVDWPESLGLRRGPGWYE